MGSQRGLGPAATFPQAEEPAVGKQRCSLPRALGPARPRKPLQTGAQRRPCDWAPLPGSGCCGPGGAGEESVLVAAPSPSAPPGTGGAAQCGAARRSSRRAQAGAGDGSPAPHRAVLSPRSCVSLCTSGDSRAAAWGGRGRLVLEALALQFAWREAGARWWLSTARARRRRPQPLQEPGRAGRVGAPRHERLVLARRGSARRGPHE